VKSLNAGEPRTLCGKPAINRAIDHFSPEIAACGALVSVGDDWSPHVLGHENLLDLILFQLLSNALKFVRPGVSPRLRIWAEDRSDFVRIWIADNGIGIPRECHRKAFGIFERLHPAESYPGTGMGLAIVSKAVERMKGHVGFESETNEGSRFWFELVRADLERPKPVWTDTKAQREVAAIASGRDALPP